MKPSDFSVQVTNFLTHYLAAQRNLSPNTIKAYRDVFTLLLRFCRDTRGIALERVSLAQLDAPLVEAFLDHRRRFAVAEEAMRLITEVADLQARLERLREGLRELVDAAEG